MDYRTTFRRLAGSAILVVGLIGASAATAQDNNQEQQVRKMVQENRELLDENVENLSDQQLLERAQQMIKDGKQTLGQTNRRLEAARSQDKDIEKINCINDKQAAIKGFLKIGEQNYVILKKAVSEGDQDREEAEHRYTIIAISHQKIQELDEEAQMCAGEIQRYAEGTSVEVDIDEDQADEPRYLTDEPTAGDNVLPELTTFQ